MTELASRASHFFSEGNWDLINGVSLGTAVRYLRQGTLVSAVLNILLLLGAAQANTRQPDLGLANDTLCTVEVLKIVPTTDITSGRVPLWAKGSCLHHYRLSNYKSSYVLQIPGMQGLEEISALIKRVERELQQEFVDVESTNGLRARVFK